MKKIIGPVAIIIIGVYFVLRNIYGIDLLESINISFSNIWPVLVIIYGLIKLVKQ